MGWGAAGWLRAPSFPTCSGTGGEVLRRPDAELPVPFCVCCYGRACEIQRSTCCCVGTSTLSLCRPVRTCQRVTMQEVIVRSLFSRRIRVLTFSVDSGPAWTPRPKCDYFLQLITVLCSDSHALISAHKGPIQRKQALGKHSPGSTPRPAAMARASAACAAPPAWRCG